MKQTKPSIKMIIIQLYIFDSVLIIFIWLSQNLKYVCAWQCLMEFKWNKKENNTIYPLKFTRIQNRDLTSIPFCSGNCFHVSLRFDASDELLWIANCWNEHFGCACVSVASKCTCVSLLKLKKMRCNVREKWHKFTKFDSHLSRFINTHMKKRTSFHLLSRTAITNSLPLIDTAITYYLALNIHTLVFACMHANGAIGWWWIEYESCSSNGFLH